MGTSVINSALPPLSEYLCTYYMSCFVILIMSNKIFFYIKKNIDKKTNRIIKLEMHCYSGKLNNLSKYSSNIKVFLLLIHCGIYWNTHLNWSIIRSGLTAHFLGGHIGGRLGDCGLLLGRRLLSCN